MIDIDFLEHLVDSMNVATTKLDEAVKKGKKGQAIRLKIFLVDLADKMGRVLTNQYG